MTLHEALVTLEELSRLLPVSRRWLRREVKAGRLPFLQAGRRRLFNVNAVRVALADRAAKGSAK